MSDIIVDLREKLEIEVALALSLNTTLDTTELRLLAQRAVEAIGLVERSSPDRVLRELLQIAPSACYWRAVLEPVWDHRSRELREKAEGAGHGAA